MARRLKVGDVIEIETRQGLAYAQYTHRVEGMGYLIRVVEGTFQTRPSDLAAVVRGRTAFKAVFPLQRAINLKMPESTRYARLLTPFCWLSELRAGGRPKLTAGHRTRNRSSHRR
jgi:hypothetical protein